MRKKYEDPMFELMRLQISNQLLNPSTFDPEDEIKEDIIDDVP